MEDGGKRRWRRWVVLGAVLAGAVLIPGVGLWATDSGPFEDRYCWGAWERDSGPGFLGERMLRTSGSERTSTESAAPGSGGRTATCTVSVASSGSNDSSGRSNGFHDRLTLTYGPVPEAPEKRREWIDRHFSGSASPLPDALDGPVASDRAMLILPEACDAAGRPSAVTLWGESWSDGAEGRRAMPLGIASLPDVSVGGAARTCEAGGLHPPGYLRLTTVVDPAPARIFAHDAGNGGTRLERAKTGPSGFGSIDVTRGVYLAQCQTGEVAFVVERMQSVSGEKGKGPNLVRALLPTYVAAEAERIGCGPVRLTLPEVLE